MNKITSIGLDIGTSTTKLVVSQLSIGQATDGYRLPSYQIVDRQILYRSPIYPTPLQNEYEIDMEELSTLLTYEYEQSHISLQDVKAGAVIITGETARKENAETIVHYLADRAGDFVVATAGAHLEGILAGKGSGAMKRSENTDGIVANNDIGGGTANVAFFQRGRPVRTVTFHVGGRLIRLTEQGEVTYIAQPIQSWLEKNQFELHVGKIVSYEELYHFCYQLNESMLTYLLGSPKHNAHLLLALPDEGSFGQISEWMFSGGVGHMLGKEQPVQMSEVTKYGDIGPLLAYTLKLVAKTYEILIREAEETTRATVIGAGMQNTEISGATVYVDERILPIKNIPLLHVSLEENELDSFQCRLSKAMLQGRQIYDSKQDPPFALALANIPYCTYDMVQRLADDLHNQYTFYFPQSTCLVVICERDMAKALGQALAKRCQLHLICIDQVDFSYGDYIDLGLSVAGEAISISIKTLAFT
ncbi:ethanolamine ammonia-lyase reactivating factor EutA [Ectobacillus sp. sgz5001026]|uniref:ethanolamine ammonia-lyase reactivating factor EutA n=1 Tax=Ectobacillus sp. sgz5001026 TaxID=3242473 RepID=UPI0036D34156